MSKTLNIHYKLIIDPDDETGHGVVFIGFGDSGYFAVGAPIDSLPQTAIAALALAAEYHRGMRTGILGEVLGEDQLGRYDRKAAYLDEVADDIRNGVVKPIYALSVELYSIRESESDEDLAEELAEVYASPSPADAAEKSK